MLLSGCCEVFGIEEKKVPSFVVHDTEDVLISVVGRPGREAIEEAVAREREGDVLIAPPENGPYVAVTLPRWRAVSGVRVASGQDRPSASLDIGLRNHEFVLVERRRIPQGAHVPSGDRLLQGELVASEHMDVFACER